MASLNLGQYVVKKKRKKIDSFSYSGQILSPIPSCNNATLRFSFYHNPLWHQYTVLIDKNMKTTCIYWLPGIAD